MNRAAPQIVRCRVCCAIFPQAASPATARNAGKNQIRKLLAQPPHSLPDDSARPGQHKSKTPQSQEFATRKPVPGWGRQSSIAPVISFFLLQRIIDLKISDFGRPRILCHFIISGILAQCLAAATGSWQRLSTFLKILDYYRPHGIHAPPRWRMHGAPAAAFVRP
ncbi:MAG: hypothetical protein FWD68_18360 [Alphaproteobacteria bacterium]|nr:hypothetical protein [Alphaproteobacteria bacterium]